LIAVSALTFFFVPLSLFAQSASDVAATLAVPTSYPPELVQWREEPGLFLESNRFCTTKELLDRSLWLQIGYGKPFVTLPKQDIQIGLEALVWSRLRILSDFRFPVETADYYFGAYLTWDHNDFERAQQINWPAGESWRLRIGHISSHEVDGLDSVASGSSSHYSRELIEIMRQFRVPLFLRSEIFLTLGVRGYFHQVTKIEPWISFPASLTCPIVFRDRDGVCAFISSGNGPVWPSVSGGLRAQQAIGNENACSGLELSYYYGASWAGTDSGAKVSQLKLQLDVRGL
jgi:hypothetical protein